MSGEQRRQRRGRGSAHRALPRCIRAAARLDRAQDAVMAAATADIVVERGGDLGARRRRVTVEQRLRRDQDAGQTIAALAGLLVEEGLLQRVRAVRRAEPLDRHDLPCRRRSTAPCRRISPARHRSAPCSCRTAPGRSRNSFRSGRGGCAGRRAAGCRRRRRHRPGVR